MSQNYDSIQSADLKSSKKSPKKGSPNKENIRKVMEPMIIKQSSTKVIDLAENKEEVATKRRRSKAERTSNRETQSQNKSVDRKQKTKKSVLKNAVVDMTWDGGNHQ